MNSKQVSIFFEYQMSSWSQKAIYSLLARCAALRKLFEYPSLFSFRTKTTGTVLVLEKHSIASTVPSVEPSSHITISNGKTVCDRRLSSCSIINRRPLRVAITTETFCICAVLASKLGFPSPLHQALYAFEFLASFRILGPRFRSIFYQSSTPPVLSWSLIGSLPTCSP